MKKRGQVTLFIIIGIVIVVVIALILFLRSYVLESDFQKSLQKAQTIPQQFVPIKEELDLCLSEVSTQAVNTLSLQGGYIELPTDPIPRSPIINPFSNSLEILPGMDTVFWFYESSNGIKQTQIPTIKEMETQLDNYLNENLESCFLDIKNIQGYDIKFNENRIQTKTKIQENHVEITIDYPTEITLDELTYTIKEHYIILDLELGKLHKIANEIINKENEEFFLEEKTIDMLTIYDQIPYRGQDFDCTQKIWYTKDVENNLKQIINANVDTIKIKNTKNTYAYDYFLIDLGKSYSEIETKFMYLTSWPFDLRINGGEEILKSDLMIDPSSPPTAILSSILCLNNWQFIYDVKYPVLISLTSDNLRFQFATQVIVDNNLPRIANTEPSDVEEPDTKACKAATKPGKIYVFDDEREQPIDNAILQFNCVGTICNLGKTTNGELTTELPLCMNGELIASREGYLSKGMITNTNEEIEEYIYLKPKYNLRPQVKIIENGKIRNIENDETVVIQLFNENEDYMAVITQDSETVDLVSGFYFIKGYLTKEEKINLKGYEIESCAEVPRGGILGYIGLTKKQCVKKKIEDTELNQVLTGGAEFDHTFESNKLRNSNTLIIYIIKNKVPQSLEELQQIYNQIKTNNENPSFILPELK